MPLTRTRVEREARRDPRPSIEERYASRDAYLSRVRGAAIALVGVRYLLAEDVESVMRRSADQWDLLTNAPAGPISSR